MRCLQPPVQVTLDAVIFSPEPVPTVWGALLPLQSSAIELHAHRLVLVERLLGFRWRSVAHPFDDLAHAEVDGWSLVLHRTDGRRIRTFVYGDPGQLAWIAGHIVDRVRRRRLALPGPVDAPDRERVLQLARTAQRFEVA